MLQRAAGMVNRRLPPRSRKSRRIWGFMVTGAAANFARCMEKPEILSTWRRHLSSESGSAARAKSN
jgi:hypothetical protein